MRILRADLADAGHQAAVVDLLDMYCRDEFGDGRPLSAAARAHLIPGLIRHGGARVFLAYEGDLAIGLAICLVGFSSFRAQPLAGAESAGSSWRRSSRTPASSGAAR
jgi:hypothetical protein